MLSGILPQQSDFNLSQIFGISGIGNIGTGLGLLRRALHGDTIQASEIPAELQNHVMKMAMTNVGVNPAGDNAMQLFLSNESVITQVREAIQADLNANIDTPENSILFQAVNDMNGHELKALLTANPEVASMITGTPDFQNMMAERVSNVTLAEVLQASGIPAEGIKDDFLSKNMNDLTVEDLQNLDPAAMDTLIPALPQDVFNAQFITPFNTKMDEEHQVTAPAQDSYAARQEAYETAKNNLIEHGPAGISGLFNSVASMFGKGTDLEAEFYSRIASSIDENALTQLKTMAQDQANAQIQNFDLDDMQPDAIRSFFDENKALIAAQLTNQENWPKIEEAINADLLIRNQQRIIDAMLPEMTENGLSMFQQVLDGLPPQIKGLLTSFIDFAADLLEKIGVDMDGFAPEPARTADQDATPVHNDPIEDLTPEEIEEINRTTIATVSAPPIPGQ